MPLWMLSNGYGIKCCSYDVSKLTHYYPRSTEQTMDQKPAILNIPSMVGFIHHEGMWNHFSWL